MRSPTRRRPPAGPVLVGVDGSPGGRAAAALGAHEARWRHVPLLLVHGCQGDLPHATVGLVTQPAVYAVRQGARAVLEEIENRTRADHPGLAVRSTLAGGGAASSLVELSRGASLVVVGRRGAGGFPGLLVGSVGAQVAMYAHAPVIVVRPRDDDTDDTDDTGHGPSGPGPVVVGVDCSASAQDVLAFAFEEATHRRAPLVALHVGPTPMPAEVLAGCAQQYPEVRVIESVRGVTHPAAALIEASRGAALVVVGSRGRGGFASLLLGSVSQALIGHAYSCVAVVRPVTKL